MKIGKEFHLLFMDLRSSDLCSVSSTDDGYNTFYIIEAVYNEYVIFHCMNFQNGRKTDMILMHGRYYLANIHLGVGCRYKDCPNLLLGHLSSQMRGFYHG